MATFAVISEFNPFHNGHKYLFDRARALGADEIVCVMSGNAVQRGETAVLEKHARAKMALECGADLVLELPYPWCASSAEAFASCGVRIASEFADTLIFGSECGDIEPLEEAAQICVDEKFICEYKNSLKGNSGAAQRYFEMLFARTGREYFSNDILGIEYIKASKRQKNTLSFVTVKREGGSYASCEIADGTLQSASAIRALMRDGNLELLERYMPSECVKILKNAFNFGEISFFENLEKAQKLYFRIIDPKALDGIAELDEGLAHRICQAAHRCREESMLELLRTKRYTDARLRRSMLFALTGVRTEDVKGEPVYTELLGSNEKGRRLIASKRKDTTLAVLAKPADIPNTDKARRQFELSSKLASVFALSLEGALDTSSIIARSPIIT